MTIKPNKRRLKSIARWLDGKSRHKMNFDMQIGLYVKRGEDEEHVCGTVGCIAGYAIYAFGDAPGLVKKTLALYPHRVPSYEAGEGMCTPWSRISYEAAELLGLTALQAEELFRPPPSLGIINSACAARCIRRFIVTGRIDWVDTGDDV